MKKNPIIIISVSIVIIACLVVALVFGRGTAKLNKKGTTTIEKTPGNNTTATTKPNNGQMTYRIEPGLRYESQHVQSGYYLKELMSGEWEITIAMGERSTGGYSIAVDSVEIRDKDVIIKVVETSPKPTDVVTQAFTYPIVRVIVSEEPELISIYEVDTQKVYNEVERG